MDEYKNIYFNFLGVINKNIEIDSRTVHYWSYLKPEVYLSMVLGDINKCAYTFIPIEFEALKILTDNGIEVNLVYPEKELKEEYLERYIEMGVDFIILDYYMTHWDEFIDIFKRQVNCKHIVLQSGQYLQDVL